ncbi:hypothetical protein EDD95_2810, partial [Streptomyces sp. CEV 2-1]
MGARATAGAQATPQRGRGADGPGRAGYPEDDRDIRANSQEVRAVHSLKQWFNHSLIA